MPPNQGTLADFLAGHIGTVDGIAKAYSEKCGWTAISRGWRKASDQITFVKDRPGHDQRYAIDASKISDQLGWQATGAESQVGVSENGEVVSG